MKITILYFASLRETLGLERESVEVPAEIATMGALRNWLRLRGGAWAESLVEGRAVRMAVNRQLAGPESLLVDDAEVAFFPPVTGG
ncbi:MAG: molybdopterin converting factor subunit 1 [Betaproteobacteria bacterium]|nr:molybdopterin converting factor subunit 1 [Betaproteobacteria bacterium]